MVSIGAFSFDITADTSQATRALAELQRQTAAFGSGSNFMIAPRVNVAPANTAIAGLQRTAQQTAAAIERPISPKVDTRQAESALQKFGQSFTQGLAFGGAAAVGLKAIDALKSGIEGTVGAGLQYNAQLQIATKTLELFTGSAGKAQEALKILRSYADFTPFDTAEVIQGGQAFIQVVNGDIAAMDHLVHLAGQLAATNPTEGFAGATRAIREVLGGQTTSIADRFNIPLSTIQSLKDAGLSGVALAEALVKAAHGSEELVTQLSQGATGQLSNFRSALANLGKTATEPLFKELTDSLVGLNATLSNNKDSWDGWAAGVGAAIAYPVRELKVLGDLLNFVGSRLPLANVTPQQGTSQSGFFGPTSGTTRARSSPPAPGSIVNPGRSDATQPATVRVAALTAEELKTQAEKLGKELKEIDDDATRHALQRLGDEVDATRKASAEKKQSIEDVRDTAVRAADQTRDAAIRALDDEAQRRSRVRTLEDRGIADTNAAILDGLEQAHNASLKGLDEQATAIQKRRDEAVKGIDEEIRAVDHRRDVAVRGIDEEVRAIGHRRDAALRALDEESRTEARRHTAALRNIDAERDRRLGIIDQQLKQLDAAAERDQRRQTDQSLGRSLAEAKTDLKNADTPEERRRAQQAVNDAEAAIQRERTNRRREDARDRLRDQADQIREAADTARKVEEAKNQATNDALGARKVGVTDSAQAETERLAERKRALDDQAKTDTERLQAVKARVDEETKIEGASIQARVVAENEGYQQTVKDQQAAFTEQSRALADQRTTEDTKFDERRKAVQTSYEGAVDAARTAADGEIRELARTTASTTEELDNQKRKWTEWKEHILGEIDAAMKAGDPTKLKHLQASPDDSTYGPLDPPGYTQDSTYGPFDPAGYRDAAKAVGTSTADGLAMGIGSPESVAAATAATDKLIQDGVIDPAKQLLGIASPSTVFAGFGADTAQGFLDGYQQLDLAAPIRKPFEDSIVWLQGLPPIFLTSGGDTAGAWEAGYVQYDIYAAGRKPFEDLDVWMGGLPNRMSASGAASAAAFGTGWTSRNPGAMIQNDLTQIINNANNLSSSWGTVGGNFATSLINAFNQTIANNPLQVPGGGGYSTSYGGSSASTGSLGSFGGGGLAYTGTKFGQNDMENYLVGKGYTPGTDAFNQLWDQYFAGQAAGYAPPPDMTVTGHAFGGFAPKDRMSWFGEGGPEFGLPPQAGSILPADVSRNLLAVASGQAVGGSAPVQINIDMSGATISNEIDKQALLSDMAHTVAQLFASATGTRPGAPSTLIGA